MRGEEKGQLCAGVDWAVWFVCCCCLWPRAEFAQCISALIYLIANCVHLCALCAKSRAMNFRTKLSTNVTLFLTQCVHLCATLRSCCSTEVSLRAEQSLLLL